MTRIRPEHDPKNSRITLKINGSRKNAETLLQQVSPAVFYIFYHILNPSRHDIARHLAKCFTGLYVKNIFPFLLHT
ncbi:MAG: hypothetical protein ABIW38_03440 [Ferruginibacter sp.]